MALSADKKVFALILDEDSFSRLRGIYEMYTDSDEQVLARLISSAGRDIIDHFWVKKII